MDVLRFRRRKVRLVAANSLLDESPTEWLSGLRWVAIFGMTSTILLGKLLVPSIRMRPLFACVAAVALFNVYATWIEKKLPPTLRLNVVGAIAIDAILLGCVLWFSGGVGNPFAVFLSFQIMVAGFLTSPASTGGIAMLVVAIALVLLRAPHLPWASAGEHAEEVRRVGELCALTGVALVMGFSSYAFGRRLEGLRDESGRAARFADLGRVAGGIAHELNTPLGTIVVASGELLAQLDEGRLDEVRVLGTTIAEQAKRASDTIALVRGQVRTEELASLVDLGALLGAFVRGELAVFGFAGELVFTVPEGLVAWGIPAAIRQIVSNLLKNAVDATRAVEVPRIEVSAARRKRGMVVAVRDNGEGIRPEELQRIGQPFHSTKGVAGGAGLGLYVSGLLARQMGAQIEIETGEGATAVSLILRCEPGARAVGGVDATH